LGQSPTGAPTHRVLYLGVTAWSASRLTGLAISVDTHEFNAGLHCDLEDLPDLALMDPQRPIRVSTLGDVLEDPQGFIGMRGCE
jgi:hypothetical protein